MESVMVMLPIGLENSYSADFLKSKVLFGLDIKTSLTLGRIDYSF